MDPINYSKIVRQLRDRLGMTQEKFAQMIGVAFSTVNQWENGKRIPQPFLKKKLLEMKELYLDSRHEGDQS